MKDKYYSPMLYTVDLTQHSENRLETGAADLVPITTKHDPTGDITDTLGWVESSVFQDEQAILKCQILNTRINELHAWLSVPHVAFQFVRVQGLPHKVSHVWVAILRPRKEEERNA